MALPIPPRGGWSGLVRLELGGACACPVQTSVLRPRDDGLAPLTGRVVASLAAGDDPGTDLSPLDPDRFDLCGREPGAGARMTVELLSLNRDDVAGLTPLIELPRWRRADPVVTSSPWRLARRAQGTFGVDSVLTRRLVRVRGRTNAPGFQRVSPCEWVKNLKRERAVQVRLGGTLLDGRARVVEDAGEDALARRLLVGKYVPRSHDDLPGWELTALPSRSAWKRLERRKSESARADHGHRQFEEQSKRKA